METKAERGYLVLADVSGFTSYLATTELEHAHDILHDLLDTIICAMAPALTRIEVEGDAVFAYAPASRMQRGETLLEILESTYATFRERVRSITRQTTCECRACRDIPKLDLKFIVHAGEYIARHYAGSFNLVGSDVNLVHRLLKNHVSEATGWHAYILVTGPVLQLLGITPENMHHQTESYEHLDDVATYAYDLHPRYDALQAGKRVFVSAEEAHAVATTDIQASPGTVWMYMHDPQLRGRWANAVITPTDRSGGRTAAGAGNHCAHGKEARLETIADWKPFEYWTADMAMGKMRCRYTFHLTPEETGTHLTANLVMLSGPAPRPVLRFFARRAWKTEMQPNLVRLARMCEEYEGAAAESGAAAASANPTVPA